MKKDLDLNKVKRFAKSLRIVMNVFYWSSVVAIIIAAVLLPLINFLPKDYLTAKHFLNSNASFNFSFNGLQFSPGMSISENADFTPVIMSILGFVFIYGFALSVIFKQVRNILKTVETGTPFEKDNTKRLSKIGAVLIIGSFLFNAMNGLVTINIIKLFEWNKYSFVYSPDLFILFTGLLILILAGIFNYGAYLQNEYDTTL